MESCKIPAFARVWKASARVCGPARGSVRTKPVLGKIMTGGALIMALAASLHSVPALAHAMLTKAQPPRRAQLTQPPPQVRLWFNEEVEKDYASLTVSHGDKPVTEAKPEVTTPNPSCCPCRNCPPGNTPSSSGCCRWTATWLTRPTTSR